MKLIDLQGVAMPALGFGTWQLTGKGCVKATREAIGMGYRHLDTAQIYENESEVGQAVAEAGVARSELFVTTKVWITNLARERVGVSVDESLNRLRMDYVDLLLIHWPNPDAPLAETLGAMRELQAKGKVRAIGVSNFPVSGMRRAVEECGAPIACNQVEYHVLLPQRAVLDYARKHGIAVTAYSPLARAKLVRHPGLEAVGRKYGKTAGQVALRWLIEQSGVAAIPKAASLENMKANLEIFDFSLSEVDQRAILALATNTRVIDPDFAPEWDAA